MRVVSDGYFRAMGIRVLEGRAFSDGDVSGGNRVLLVSREFSRRYFGTESPVGRTVGVEPRRYEVVGVVDDVRHAGLSAQVEPEYYVPLRQYPLQTTTRPYFVARTRGNPLDLASTVRSLARQVDPRAGVDLGVSTMADIVSESVARPRFNTVLASGFAAIAVGLAAIGIYGVMAYSVAQRTREIGIRLALGARHSNVLRLILREGAATTAAGIVVGLAVAAAVTRYLEGMLFGLTPLGPADVRRGVGDLCGCGDAGVVRSGSPRHEGRSAYSDTGRVDNGSRMEQGDDGDGADQQHDQGRHTVRKLLQRGYEARALTGGGVTG